MNKLRIASCQLPVNDGIDRKVSDVERHMQKATTEDVHLLHNCMPMKLTPEKKLWLGKLSSHVRHKDGQSAL